MRDAGKRVVAMFIIEDDLHAEPRPGEHPSLADAVAELRRVAALPAGSPSLVPPCGNPGCGRGYHIVEYDTSSRPWRELSRVPYLEVSESGVRWVGDE